MCCHKLWSPPGPRPTPEGEDVSRAAGGGGVKEQGQQWKQGQGQEQEWKQGQEAQGGWKREEAVINFDIPTSRRAGADLGDLASSPLIAGDPDSREEKYRRRAPTDWCIRCCTTTTHRNHKASFF